MEGEKEGGREREKMGETERKRRKREAEGEGAGKGRAARKECMIYHDRHVIGMCQMPSTNRDEFDLFLSFSCKHTR